MAAVVADQGRFQETLVGIGHPMQVIQQGGQDFIQIPVRVGCHGEAVFGAFRVQALGLERS